MFVVSTFTLPYPVLDGHPLVPVPFFSLSILLLLELPICDFPLVLHFFFFGMGWDGMAGEACAGWVDFGCEGIIGLLCVDRSACSIWMVYVCLHAIEYSPIL